MGDLGAVPPDLRPGALVVRQRVGRVAVLVEEDPLGVLVGQRSGHATAPLEPSAPGRLDDLGAEDLEQLAPLDETLSGSTTFRW